MCVCVVVKELAAKRVHARRGGPVAAAGARVARQPAASVSGHARLTPNNVNVNATQYRRYPHPCHHYRQPREEWDETAAGREELRRKLAQWRQWQRRYGVLCSLHVAQQLTARNSDTAASPLEPAPTGNGKRTLSPRT